MDERRAVFHAKALLSAYEDQRSAAHRPPSIDCPYGRLACKNGVAQSKRNIKLPSGRMQKYFDGLALFLRNTVILCVPFEDQLRKIREFIADLPFYPNATFILVLIMDKQIRIRKLIVFVHVFNDQTKDVCNVFVHILFSILFSLAEGAVIETDALYGHALFSRQAANLSRSPSVGQVMRLELIPPGPHVAFGKAKLSSLLHSTPFGCISKLLRFTWRSTAFRDATISLRPQPVFLGLRTSLDLALRCNLGQFAAHILGKQTFVRLVSSLA